MTMACVVGKDSGEDARPSKCFGFSFAGAAVARNEMFQRLEESNASRGPWSLIFWRQAGMHL